MGLNSFNLNKIDKNHRLRSTAMRFFSFLPDAAYLKFVYRMRTGKKLNLDNPQGFCEKLNWLKLHDKHPEYSKFVDKIAVREVIQERLGSGYVFPLLGSWECFDDIDWEKLPNQFVLKCNHDSGSVKIIKDKSSITKEEKEQLKRHFTSCLKSGSFFAGREYPYQMIKGKILAEQFMESTDGKGIRDYKFFCFNGEPKIMFVATDRFTDVKFDFFDMDFTHLEITNIHPQSGRDIEKPKCFEEMKRIAKTLSKGMKFVRIDLYEINGKVYFGEFTFFHGGGFVQFIPQEWEMRLGEWIELK